LKRGFVDSAMILLVLLVSLLILTMCWFVGTVMAVTSVIVYAMKRLVELFLSQRTPGLARKRKTNTTSLFAEAITTGLVHGMSVRERDSTGR
jgi:hypothetical protein